MKNGSGAAWHLPLLSVGTLLELGLCSQLFLLQGLPDPPGSLMTPLLFASLLLQHVWQQFVF